MTRTLMKPAPKPMAPMARTARMKSGHVADQRQADRPGRRDEQHDQAQAGHVAQGARQYRTAQRTGANVDSMSPKAAAPFSKRESAR